MLEKITKVLREYKGNNELVINESTTFEELELDSLDTVELVMNLEEEIGKTIELSESIKTIGDLLKVIESSK